jgi:hypothetical protein
MNKITAKKEVIMPDKLNDLFEEINKIDQPSQTNQSGSYTREEIKREVGNGVERIVKITRIQILNQDGSLNIIDEIRYLCQRCRSWILLGADGFSNDEKILCEKCSHEATIRSFLKPLWAPFVKFDEKK